MEIVFIKSFIVTFGMLFMIGPVFLTFANTFVLKGPLFGCIAAAAIVLMDWVYIITSVFFVEKITNSISEIEIFFEIFGCLLLFWMSFSFLRTKHIHHKEKKLDKDLVGTFVKMFLLTGSSPTTVIAYAGIFGSFASKIDDPKQAMFGGMVGTFVFYLMFSTIFTIIRKKISDKILIQLAKLGGVIILLFAMLASKSVVLRLLA